MPSEPDEQEGYETLKRNKEKQAVQYKIRLGDLLISRPLIQSS